MSYKKYEIVATCYDKRGRVLSSGKNQYLKTHPLQYEYASSAGMPEKIYLHAEVDAIIRAKGKKIHKISIERYDAEGNPKLAKPCPVCSIAIKTAGIQKIEYTL